MRCLIIDRYDKGQGESFHLEALSYANFGVTRGWWVPDPEV